ncbi:hypothetical protein M5D96_001295, partial [Drosophila gunungcola]
RPAGNYPIQQINPQDPSIFIPRHIQLQVCQVRQIFVCLSFQEIKVKQTLRFLNE